jgi:hypothetical protein
MYYYRLERSRQPVGFNDEPLFVHFAIFKALFERVMMTGNLQTQILFKKIQISAHFTARGSQVARGCA